MKIGLKLTYDGTNFCGWQTQPNKRSVEKEIEDALFLLLGEKVIVYTSGRTDAGVHALGQVAHFETDKIVNPKTFYRSLNAHLPSDVQAISSWMADDEFDARFSAKTKTYVYKFYLNRFELPLKKGRELRVNDNIDISLMKQEVSALLGEHDFSSFVSKKSGKTNFIRTIYSAEIKQVSEFEFEFVISGNGFLYNMVRIRMGTLLDIASHRSGVLTMKEILSAKNRASAGKTAPAYALYLQDVKY